MIVPIPTDDADPRERLVRAHELLRGAKASTTPRCRPTCSPTRRASSRPPSRALAARTTIEVMGRTRPPLNVVISNVPGPRTPLFCAGAKLEANYPVSVVVDGVGLNITVMSYLDHLDFGIVADRDQIHDVWPLIDHLHTALDELQTVLDRSGRTGVRQRPRPSRSGRAARA